MLVSVDLCCVSCTRYVFWPECFSSGVLKDPLKPLSPTMSDPSHLHPVYQNLKFGIRRTSPNQSPQSPFLFPSRAVQPAYKKKECENLLLSCLLVAIPFTGESNHSSVLLVKKPPARSDDFQRVASVKERSSSIFGFEQAKIPCPQTPSNMQRQYIHLSTVNCRHISGLYAPHRDPNQLPYGQFTKGSQHLEEGVGLRIFCSIWLQKFFIFNRPLTGSDTI